MSAGELNRNWLGLAALYHLNGDSTDSSTNGVNGTDTDITYVSGKFGTGASFNGTSSRISLGTSRFDSADLTIMYWLKNKGTDKTAYHWARNSNADQFANFGIFTQASNLKIATNDGGAVVKNVMPYSTLQDGDHLVWLLKSDGTAQVYRNGNLVVPLNALTGFGAWNNNITNGTSIGRAGDFAGYFFDGVLDEIAVFDPVLTPKEIKDYYSWAVGRFTKVL